MEASAGITYAPENEDSQLSPNHEVEKAMLLLDGARLKRKAMECMDRGGYGRASMSLREQSQKLCAFAAATGDESIVAEAQELDRLYRNIEERKDLPHTRRSKSYQSSYTQRGRKEKARLSDKNSK